MLQNPGLLPDYPQNWITCSLCQVRHSLKISERSVHNFLSYLANTQTDRQTKTGKNITSLPEVIRTDDKHILLEKMHKYINKQHSRKTRYPLNRACSSQFADRSAFISASLFDGGVNPDANSLGETVSVVLLVCVQSTLFDNSLLNMLCDMTLC